MGPLRNTALLGLAAVAHGAEYPTAPPQDIKWGPCEDIANGSVPVVCAEYHVPLDYTNPSSNETLRLQLVKAPAPQQPSLGTIQLNFGGPGSPGRQGLADTGLILHA